MSKSEEVVSRRSMMSGLLFALAATPFVVAAPSQAEAQERQFVSPSHTPRVERSRGTLRGPRTHRSLFRTRRRIIAPRAPAPAR